MKVIGISGPSCSGKSTLARHLRLVLPNAKILYEDDFYRPESELPLDSAGRLNWDCPESFDLTAMRSNILNIKKAGNLINQDTREEHNNNSGSYLLTESEISELRKEFAALTQQVLLLDGILLYHKGSEVADLPDLKILFPFEKNELKCRREQRSGYETAEGFWTDPPNYFDDLVWPEFVKHCSYLYEGEKENYNKLSHDALIQGIWMPPTTDMPAMLKAIATQLRGKT